MRGLNAFLATVKTDVSAPIIIGQRLRRGACGSPRGAARMISDALATITRLRGVENARVLFRADSAFYGHASISSAIKARADVSVTARMDPAVKRAIATIPDSAWTAIEYTNAIYDEATTTWISNGEVAEVSFTAFTSRRKSEQITGRLVVRRIPELNKKNLEQPTLFDTHRFHAFFTTSTLDTVTADTTHRAHAVIELVNADLKNSALAHMPSGVFTANAAWLGTAWPARPRPRSAGNASASPRESRPRPAGSSSTCLNTGHGKKCGRPCSSRTSDQDNPHPSDRRADIGITRTTSGTPRAARSGP